MENSTYVIIIAVSMIGLLSGLVLKKIERSILTEPLIALFAGIIISHLGFDIENSHELTALIARYTIIIAVTASALRVPYSFLKDFRWESTLVLIIGMLGMWGMTAVVLKFVLNFNWIYCLLLAAILTPTDPVISSAVVSGDAARETLPSRIRRIISLESGANDGLAVLLFALPVFFITSVDKPYHEWLTKTILFENMLGIAGGLLIGMFIGKMVHRAHEKDLMNSKSLLASVLFLTLFIYALSEIAGVNGVVAVFSAALTYGFSINKGEELKQERIQDALERLFIIPVFVLFGMLLPIDKWLEMGWQYVFMALGVIFLRRIPIFLAMKPLLKNFKSKLPDILFMGWFGPIGVAAMYYAFLAEQQLKAFSDDIWPVVSFVIFTSVIVHGLTSYPLARMYASLTRRNNT